MQSLVSGSLLDLIVSSFRFHENSSTIQITQSTTKYALVLGKY